MLFRGQTFTREMVAGTILDFELDDPKDENTAIEMLDYSNTTVKGAYDKLPKITYPLVNILEIQNTEDYKYTDNNGEHISRLTYQIECLSRDMKNIQAADSAMFMGSIVSSLLTGERYKMKRVGTPTFIPLVSDQDVIRYVQRYTCSLDLDHNTIYSES